VTNQTRLVLDPPGWKRTAEEGMPFFFRGSQVYEKFNGPLFAGEKFWNPPGSDWLLPEPRQFSPTFYADDRLGQHVLRQSLWTFAAGLSPREWSPTHRAGFGGFGGTDYPDDQWISLYCEPGTPSLFPVDFVAMGLTVGSDLPFSMKVVGVCNSTPVGTPLGDAGYSSYFTPFLQVLAYPPPNDVFLLGWSNLALLFLGDKVYFLRTYTGDKLFWELLETLDRANYLSGIQRSVAANSAGGGLSVAAQMALATQTVRAEVTAVLVTEVGDNANYLMLSNGQGKLVELRPSPGIGAPGGVDWMPPGAWWIAVPEGGKAQFQLHVAGYEAVNTAGFRPEFFNFGPGQGPTQEPDARPTFNMHTGTAGNYTTVADPEGTTLTSIPSGEKITYRLMDIDTGASWDSQPDGSAYRGTFFLSLVPRTAPGKDGGYLAPKILAMQALFPELLLDRVNSQSVLTDEEFDLWECESSYYQSESAKFTVSLRTVGVAALVTSGHADRFGFPILLQQNEGTLLIPVWITKAVFWVDTIDLEETTVETATLPAATAWKIKADCILVRGRVQWIGPALMLDPDNPGKVGWQFAVKRALAGSHADTSDTSKVEFSIDLISDALKFLPGTPATPEGQTEEGKQRGAWGPGPTETKTAYAKRISSEWAGNVLYTRLDGKIWVHPDLPVELAAGTEEYFPRATLFKNHESALAASRPNQVFTETGRQIVKPKANVVVVQGKKLAGTDLTPTTAIERDKTAITNLTGPSANPNFAGEEIVDRVTLKLAVSEEATKNLAKRRLNRIKRKKHIRRFEVSNLWAWEIIGNDPAERGLDVGDVLTAQDRGDFLIVHCRTREDPGGAKKTVFTCEKVPVGAVAGDIAGFWPGQGLES
jgi:hypothetical protein